MTNLGIGALQVSSGLEYLTGMPHSKGTLLAVILAMSLVATLAAVSGVEKGIRRLSNLNIVLFSSLLLFVLVCGSTLELLNGFVQNLGDYLDGLVLKTFDLYVYTGAAPARARNGWACGPCSTGPGGFPGRPSSVCSSPASPAVAACANWSAGCC